MCLQMSLDMKRFQVGSVTLWVVVFLVIFAILLMASLQFANRQSHATIVQEQEEQAFAAAEGGVHQALWLLNSGTETTTSLEALVVAEDVSNSAGEVVARYSLSFSDVTADQIRVESMGRDAEVPQVCQVIAALLRRAGSGGFVIETWEHSVSADCATPSGPVSAPLIVPIPITLGDTDPSRSLTASTPVQYYTFSGVAGNRIRLKARSSTFTPFLTLTDPTGVPIADAGQAFRLAHVRFEARVRQIQDNLLTSIGWPGGGGCNSSLYNACIPSDIENPDPAISYFGLPQTGAYVLELRSTTPAVGAYTLETEKM